MSISRRDLIHATTAVTVAATATPFATTQASAIQAQHAFRVITNEEHISIHGHIVDQLRALAGDEYTNAYIHLMRFESLYDRTVVVSGAVTFIHEFVEKHYTPHILRACNAILGDVEKLQFLTRSSFIAFSGKKTKMPDYAGHPRTLELQSAYRGPDLEEPGVKIF